MTGFKKSFQKLLRLVKRSDEKDKKKQKIVEEVSKSEIRRTVNEVNVKSQSENASNNDYLSKRKGEVDEIKTSELIKDKVLDIFTDNKQETVNEEDNKDDLNTSCDVLLPKANEITASSKPTAIVKPCHKTDIEYTEQIHEDITKECEKQLDNVIGDKSIVEEIIEPVKDNNELPKNVTNDAIINHTNTEDCNEIQPTVIDEKVIEQVVEVKQEDLDLLSAKIVQCEDEIRKHNEEIKRVESNNEQMLIVVDEFERTIQQIVKDKEKENVCLFIQKETVERERDEVVADLHNVERAFNDLNSKFERTKDVVAGFAETEESLKQNLDVLTERLKAEEDKFAQKKTEAEAQLAEANDRLNTKQKMADREIARLTALLRKAEMNVSTMEDKIKQKTSENQDLTAMCDDLLGKLDKVAS